MKAIVMLTTVGDEEQGQLIARELIARRHAACVNMVSGVKSFYRWRGEVCSDNEHLLVIKTLADEYSAVTATIQELHSYDLPEIISFDIARGEANFLEWIAGSTGKKTGSEGEEDDDPHPEQA